MGVLSARVMLLLCVVLILAIYLQESEAWRRRIRLRVRRIRIRRVVPRIRVRRVLPRIRRVCFGANVGNGGSHVTLTRCSANPPRIRRGIPDPDMTPMLAPPPVSPVQPCAHIKTRESWGAPYVTPSPVFPFVPVKKVAFYMGGHNCTSLDTCRTHAQDLYTNTTSYNFMIGTEGTVFEGKGWNNISNHADTYNVLGYGFVFIGDCSPSEPALDSVNSLMDCGFSLHKFHPALNYSTDLSLMFTDCNPTVKNTRLTL